MALGIWDGYKLISGIILVLCFAGTGWRRKDKTGDDAERTRWNPGWFITLEQSDPALKGPLETAAKTSKLFISPQAGPAFYLANKMSDLRSFNSVPASPVWWPIHNDLFNTPRPRIPPFIGFIWSHPGHLLLSAGDMTEPFHRENWL